MIADPDYFLQMSDENRFGIFVAMLTIVRPKAHHERFVHADMDSGRMKTFTAGLDLRFDKTIRRFGIGKENVFRIFDCLRSRPPQDVAQMAERLNARHDFDAERRSVSIDGLELFFRISAPSLPKIGIALNSVGVFGIKEKPIESHIGHLSKKAINRFDFHDPVAGAIEHDTIAGKAGVFFLKEIRFVFVFFNEREASEILNGPRITNLDPMALFLHRKGWTLRWARHQIEGTQMEFLQSQALRLKNWIHAAALSLPRWGKLFTNYCNVAGKKKKRRNALTLIFSGKSLRNGQGLRPHNPRLIPQLGEKIAIRRQANQTLHHFGVHEPPAEDNQSRMDFFRDLIQEEVQPIGILLHHHPSGRVAFHIEIVELDCRVKGGDFLLSQG